MLKAFPCCEDPCERGAAAASRPNTPKSNPNTASVVVLSRIRAERPPVMRPIFPPPLGDRNRRSLRPRRRGCLAPLLAVLALAGCGGSGDHEHSTDLYADDTSKPLEFRDRGVVNRGYPIKVHDVSFAGPNGTVPAYLVLPPGKGPYPAVIYLHGAGQDRQAMVLPATWLAGRRAVALSVSSPFARPDGQNLPRGIEGLRREHDLTIQGVKELRRAVDALQSLPQVDDERIGFVGFSAGARTGAIFAGVEPRVKASVLMSGGETTVDQVMEVVDKRDRSKVRPLFEDTDGLAYIALAKPRKLYFQAGRQDEIVPRDALQRLYDAANEPKTIRWYEGGHDLPLQAYRDHLAWLAKELEIEGPAVPGALTGPG
jgi:dienelactone hydrolase